MTLSFCVKLPQQVLLISIIINHVVNFPRSCHPRHMTNLTLCRFVELLKYTVNNIIKNVPVNASSSEKALYITRDRRQHLLKLILQFNYNGITYLDKRKYFRMVTYFY